MILPDTDALLMSLFNAAFPNLQVVTIMPALPLREYPIILARRLSGGARHLEFVDLAIVQIDVFDPDRQTTSDTCRGCRGALLDAWLNQTIYPEGHIGRVEEIDGPSEVRDNDSPANLYRFNATYNILIRP